MQSINTKVKKLGSSFGIILPREIINNQQIKEGSEIEVMIKPKHKTNVKNLFGLLKGWKKPTEQIMREVDKELWGIEKTR